MSVSDPNSDVFDHGTSCARLVKPQRHNRLWFRRFADMDDLPALAHQTRSGIHDGLRSRGEHLTAIAVTGLSVPRTTGAAALVRQP